MKNALRKGGADDAEPLLRNMGGGLLGWATFPSSYTSQPKMDGVVILYSSRARRHGGPVQPGRHGHARGRPLAGPVPHVPGRLLRPRATASATRRPEASPAYGCPTGRDTCSSVAASDPITNFMDYTDDSCMNTFTAGQVARADSLTATYR